MKCTPVHLPTDRETERQRDRVTERQRDRETERPERDRYIYIYMGGESFCTDMIATSMLMLWYAF